MARLDAAKPSSGMLRRYRRYFALLAFGLLATPLVVGLVKPDSAASVLREGRNPAPAPKPPRSPGDWLGFPKQIDAYLDDRFGLRDRMIRLHKDLTHPVLFKVNTAVLIGRSGRMFYEGNEMVRQSAGLVLRDARVAQTARFIAEMRDALAKRGARLLVAMPPNSSTIYQDELPAWAQDRGRKTEYDLLLQELKGYGVKTVDLRPGLTALRVQGEDAYLLYDAHWTPRGALAGFNAVVEADGRSYVGPDNGLFEIVARRADHVRTWGILPGPAAISASFHGRDLFAPVAGQLACGDRSVGRLRPGGIRRRPEWPDDLAEIAYIDRFGNAMTGLRAALLPARARLAAAGRVLTRRRTFSDVPAGEVFWYENSNGLAEIAVNSGRADAALGLVVGTPVDILA